MKTPKRESGMSLFDLFAEPEKAETKCARWKRKNKISQYKRTIARILAGENLAPELRSAYRFMRLVMSQERKNPNELRFVQCFQLLAKHFSMLAIEQMDSILNKQRKNAHKQAESGQQPALPPTGEQQDRKETE